MTFFSANSSRETIDLFWLIAASLNMNKLSRGIRRREKKRRQVNEIFKIVVVGEKGVGKTSLVQRYTGDTLKPNPRPTIGVDFSVFFKKRNNVRIKVQVWDSTGMAAMRPVICKFFRSADAIVVAYDVTDRNSFLKLGDWFWLARENAEGDPPVYLIGTKCDLRDLRTVFARDVNLYLDMRESIAGFPVNVAHFETSSLFGVGVSEAFDSIVERFFKETLEMKALEKTRLLQGEESPPSRRRCLCC